MSDDECCGYRRLFEQSQARSQRLQQVYAAECQRLYAGRAWALLLSTFLFGLLLVALLNGG